ncbi:MAG: FmdB family zinc ribbon protein [Gammaproteobacteria bacterium]
MPLYDYDCPHCGVFSARRPMAQSGDPHPCPGCGTKADRTLVQAPAFAGMPSDLRLAHATNERSANAPTRSGQSTSHGAGCACCRRRTPSDGSPRSFPNRRPWMISH